MVMRAIWKGSISFSLVNIPISLYSATRREELEFNLLRKSDLSPIQNKRVAKADGKEVPWEQIVKGYEYEKGQYVVLEDEDFRRADVEATQTVNIQQFVPLEEIDPVLFDKPYYLEPDKRGAKAYSLLHESLKRSRKVGIAKVVIKTRQHLAAVKPEDGALVLELMHFAGELVEPGTLQIPKEKNIGAKELDMASELIEKMTDKWQPEKYKDDYREKLFHVIEEKIKLGGRAPAEVSVSKHQPTKVIDLVSVLRQSLQQAGRGAAKAAKTQYKPRRALKKAA